MVLLFLVLAIVSFDRHLAYYCPVEMSMLADAMPAHNDLPVKSCDYHEDIALKNLFCIIPIPLEISAPEYLIFHHSVLRIAPKSVWQPPEMNA